MGSRRHLASVAYGTAHAFESRTNDVNGWWALPLLLEELPVGEDYRLDLLTGEAVPTMRHAGLAALGSAWARYFHWSLERHGLTRSQVTEATLRAVFDETSEVQSWIPDGVPDHPHRVVVQIRDDRGRVHESIAEGHCSRIRDHSDPVHRPIRSGGPRDPGRIGQRIVTLG
jgi:hypothetical protein